MADATIDLSAIEAEIAKMSPEDLAKALTEMKVKQKIATKKYYNPESAKKQRLKKAAEVKAMVEMAKRLGLYDKINDEAAKQADAKLAEEEGEGEGVEEPVEA